VSKPLDALVIGAGVVGLAVARRLARAGRRVRVLDRGAPGGEASSAAAGLLAPQIEAAEAGAALAFALAARDAYVPLVAELRAAGHDVPLHRDGILLVALDDARAAELEHAARHPAEGMTVTWLDRLELRRRQPCIGDEARGAMLARHDGTVDNVALCAALAADAVGHGATLERVEVLGLRVHGGAASGVRTTAGDRDAPVVIVAAGAWSARLEGLPRALPVRPVRGQMAALPWPGVPRTVLFGHGAYIVPRGGEAVLGSTMEDAGFAKATTPEGLEHIRRETARLLPALRERPFARTWAGLRPMTPDGHPIIGPDPDVAGLLYATGHGRNGILLGPLTGDIVAELVLHGETPRDLTPYSPMRF
jgi:glycine oxidase